MVNWEGILCIYVEMLELSNILTEKLIVKNIYGFCGYRWHPKI